MHYVYWQRVSVVAVALGGVKHAIPLLQEVVAGSAGALCKADLAVGSRELQWLKPIRLSVLQNLLGRGIL